MAEPDKRLPIVTIAMVAVALMAFLCLPGAIYFNPFVAIPEAAIAIVAAVGLKRADAWAGYGYALFLCSSAAAAWYGSWQMGNARDPRVGVIGVVMLAAAAFAFLAGKALAVNAERSRGREVAWALPWLFVAAIPFSLAIFFNLVEVSTPSMEPTLLAGDSVLVRRVFSQVKRGELIAYHSLDGKNITVGRVVGVGGDCIHLDTRILYLDGRAIDEPYAFFHEQRLDPYRDNFPLNDSLAAVAQGMRELLQRQVRNGDFVVPERTLFLLGDNRDSALDSRYWGVVPVDAVIGIAMMVCYPGAESARPYRLPVEGRWSRLAKRL
jgi:signal peptidase I